MHSAGTMCSFACALGLLNSANAEERMPGQGHYADVNGIRMYYELHGARSGVPLVLLHGGGSTIEVTFGRILPHLAQHHRIIAVEEQGHGRTSDREQPVRFETSADDVAALLKQLNVAQADLFGFSNGGSVALQVAIRHPQTVRKLVFASSMTKKAGARPEFWSFIEQMDFAGMPQPLKDAFLKVNPDPQKLRTMHDKDAQRMRSFQDVPDDKVAAIRAQTLVIVADRDAPTPEHAVELTRLIPHSRLVVLLGGHGDYLGEALSTPRPSNYPELTAALIGSFIADP